MILCNKCWRNQASDFALDIFICIMELNKKTLDGKIIWYGKAIVFLSLTALLTDCCPNIIQHSPTVARIHYVTHDRIANTESCEFKVVNRQSRYNSSDSRLLHRRLFVHWVQSLPLDRFSQPLYEILWR